MFHQRAAKIKRAQRAPKTRQQHAVFLLATHKEKPCTQSAPKVRPTCAKSAPHPSPNFSSLFSKNSNYFGKCKTSQKIQNNLDFLKYFGKFQNMLDFLEWF